jgi:Lon protease-like protein
MPFRLPIFPLSVVLFPGTPLPLHIFEPRYKRMLADCLSNDRRFGLTPVEGSGDLPEAGTVGCVAEVRVNQELPDGRSNIVVVGGSRFTVSRLLPESEPYLVALVQTFDDEPGTEPSPEDVERLRELFRRYADSLQQLQDATPQETSLPDEACPLSFHIAGSLACDLGIKQRLLAERSTASRVEALTLLLPVLTSGVQAGLNVHRGAHTNGKGGTLPDALAQ